MVQNVFNLRHLPLPVLTRNPQEILVTRSNLEDKNTLMVELKNKVDELALHNEYQLRLKDMNYSEKIKVSHFILCLRSIFQMKFLEPRLHARNTSNIMHMGSLTSHSCCICHINDLQEITEKFTQDLEQSKNKFDLLRYDTHWGTHSRRGELACSLC